MQLHTVSTALELMQNHEAFCKQLEGPVLDRLVGWFGGPDAKVLNPIDFCILSVYADSDTWVISGQSVMQFQTIRLFKMGGKIELSVDQIVNFKAIATHVQTALSMEHDDSLFQVNRGA